MGLVYKNAATMGLNDSALDLESGDGPKDMLNKLVVLYILSISY